MWSSFRDELVATSLLLIFAVTGTFFLAHRVFDPKKPDDKPAAGQQAAAGQDEKNGTVLGQTAGTATPVTAGPTSPPKPTTPVMPTPSPGPNVAEVFYGTGGVYEYDAYRMEINNPRIQTDSRAGSGRKFMADIVLQNRAYAKGLKNVLKASIIRDGAVIVPEAALSASETNIILPGEQLTFGVKISLIEGTDIGSIIFKPGDGLDEVSHALTP